jgi:subtilisin-like proprotein convertase family protein
MKVHHLVLSSLLGLTFLSLSIENLQAVAPDYDSCNVVTINSTSTDVPKNIVDSSAVISNLTVSNAGTYILDVDLNLSITHTSASNLDIILKSPNGTQTVITTDNGGLNDNVFNGTLFDDQALETVTDKLYTNLVVASPLIPEGALGKFKGENPNGTWALSVGDDASGDIGELSAWSLIITACDGDFPGVASNEEVVDNTPLNLIDNNTSTPAFSIINVADRLGQLCDLQLFVDLDHTWSADIDMYLTGPNGSKIAITTDNGGANNNVFAGTIFTDSAIDNVSDRAYINLVVATPLQPEGAMSHFDGINPNGEWKLTVADDQTIDLGVLKSWRLSIKTCGLDTDQDTVADVADNCPEVPNTVQTDIDSDGFGDACDECMENPNKSTAGVCGCNVSDVDTDLDGSFDCQETCVSDPNKTSPGVCGCGIADLDADSTGITDCLPKQEVSSLVAKLASVKFSTKAKKIKQRRAILSQIQTLLDSLNNNVQANFSNMSFTSGNSQTTVNDLVAKLKKLIKKVKGGYKQDKATFNKRKKNANKSMLVLESVFNN